MTLRFENDSLILLGTGSPMVISVRDRSWSANRTKSLSAAEWASYNHWSKATKKHRVVCGKKQRRGKGRFTRQGSAIIGYTDVHTGIGHTGNSKNMLLERNAVMTEVLRMDRGLMMFQEHATDVSRVRPYGTESFLTKATQTSSHHNRRAQGEEQRWYDEKAKGAAVMPNKNTRRSATLSHLSHFLEKQSRDQLQATNSKELKPL